MKKRFFLMALTACVLILAGCAEKKVVKPEDKTAEVVPSETNVDKVVEEEQAEQVVEAVPTDEEIKQLMSISYSFFDIIRDFSEQGWSTDDGIEPQWDVFATALQPYFTDEYINGIKTYFDELFIATDYAFPTGFEFDKYFTVKSKTADTFVAESVQEDELHGTMYYEVKGKKVAGTWKIDDWTMQDAYYTGYDPAGLLGAIPPSLQLVDPYNQYLNEMTVDEYATNNGDNRLLMIENILFENPDISADSIDLTDWVDNTILSGDVDRQGRLLDLVAEVLAENGY